MDHRSATNCLHASLSYARVFTFSKFKPLSRLLVSMVPCHVSLCLPTLIPPTSLHCVACLGILWPGIHRTWPYHLHLLFFSFSTIDFCPALRLSSSSLTLSNHLIFKIFLKQPLSKHLRCFSVSSRPSHKSQPYVSIEITKTLNTFNFVRRDVALPLHTFDKSLNDDLALLFLMLT